ncbi:MAG: hypothetical protein ABSF82_07870 [Candidatus Bathyarchaeia archaeon]|jgi:glucan phosphoethanolaminetransferase (alkaline phosphatase superfamily)
MSGDFSVAPAPRIMYATPPTIKIYQITGEKLESLRQAFGSVSQDFGFMTTSLGIFFTALAALATLYHASEPISVTVTIFVVASCLSLIVALYTGIRWHRLRNEPTRIINDILSSEAAVTL